MSNVINAAFHTIRSAQAMRHSEPVFHEGKEVGRAYKIKPIVTPYPSPWRHPIYWWKMRHLRADIRRLEKEADLDPLPRHMRQSVARAEEDAFLRCVGGTRGL